MVTVGDPENPAVAYTLRHWFEGRQIAAQAGLAVVTGLQYWEGGTKSTNGVRILNTQNPTKPQLVGRIDSSSTPFLGVALLGDYAYIARGSSGVSVVDLRNPSTPVIVTTHSTAGWAFGVAVGSACSHSSVSGPGQSFRTSRRSTTDG